MSEWYGQVGGETEEENKERAILTEGAIMGLGRYLLLRNPQG